MFPAKYKRKIFTQDVENTLKEMCVVIAERYEMKTVEIGMEEDNVHYLVQGEPAMSVSRMVTIIKSITAREIFKRHPNIRRDVLWGWVLWTSGYYANTVGQYASKETIAHYIQNPGNDVKKY